MPSWRLLVLALVSFGVACGGKSESPVGATPTVDSGTTPANDGGVPVPTVTPTYDGGSGLTLACAPNDGQMGPTQYPGCTFVNEQACDSDAMCGCGCSCQCGVCNCLSAAPSYCTSDAECGPSCSAFTCVQGSCVAGGGSPWVGTWVGSPSFSTSSSFGSCNTGVGESAGMGGGGGGSYTVVVSGQGNQLTFVLEPEEVPAPFCALPFALSGNTATLIPGSTCASVAPSGGCSGVSSDVSVDTYISGSATMDGTTMTLTTTDIYAEPALGGPEGPCANSDGGTSQVNVTTYQITLSKLSNGGG